MSKVAKLVKVSLMTRVIVDETATEKDILEQCQGKFIEKIDYELSENLEEIVDDEECPYDPEFDGADDDDLQPRMHIGDNDYCSKCGDKVTGEQHKCLAEGDTVMFDGGEDRILTMGENEVELEENGWVKKSEIKRK
jgi:hypothetical protein